MDTSLQNLFEQFVPTHSLLFNDDYQQRSCSTNGHIQPRLFGDEVQVFVLIRAHRADNNHLSFLALDLLNRAAFNFFTTASENNWDNSCGIWSR